MRWASTVSEEPSFEAALAEAAETIRSHLGGHKANLAFLFLSEHHRASYAKAGERVVAQLPGSLLLGCSAKSVIGGGREVEGRPGLSLTAASLPGVELRPFHLELDDLERAGASPASGASGGTPDPFGTSSGERLPFILLSDPFSFDAERLVRALDRSFPGSRKVGGVASGGQHPGENALFLADRVHRSGAVGLGLGGAIELDTIVAQGCRPIGAPMFVTRCRGNLLQEVDGKRPVEVLQELYGAASPRDQELFRTSLFLGIEMRQAQSEYQQGDFLVRNLIGFDEESGAVAIGAMLHQAQVVQFHLRDADTSAEDLDRRLVSYRETAPASAAPEGALLFSCLGRGEYLYGRPDHDTEAFRRHLGDIPLGGFFCNGEIGPVEGTTFLHGYTSAFGIFRAPRGATGQG
jgi:small ligand-binding sensory domain FIST